MLLGAARYLAETRNFNGTVNFIFQPAEEGLGGAQAMLKDELFARFPCDTVFGMHNHPGLPVGTFRDPPRHHDGGRRLLRHFVEGRGAHGARPEQSIDPVLVASHIVTALQAIVARNVSPLDTAVVARRDSWRRSLQSHSADGGNPRHRAHVQERDDDAGGREHEALPRQASRRHSARARASISEGCSRRWSTMRPRPRRSPTSRPISSGTRTSTASAA
jgi:hypothetical protein